MNEREEIQKAKEVLKNGGIILTPTDTIWGLSADATNKEAVQKIIDLKGRSGDKSFIILVNSDRMVNQCFKEIPEVVWDLIDLTESPLTIVMHNGRGVAENVLNADGSLAFRMVKNGTCYDLLRSFNKPIISTSPNISGDITPKIYGNINKKVTEKVDYVFPKSMGGSKVSKPSKIIAVAVNGEVKILRK